MVELLVGIVLFAAATTTFLWGMQQGMVHASYLSEFQVALHAAQGRLEQLAATDFDTLLSGAGFVAANAGVQQEVLAGLPAGILAIQIRNADALNPGNPALLDLHVAVCWTFHSTMLIGENDGAANCMETSGAAYPNPGWEVNSPAMVSMRVARRS